jgi:hypothetical protein
MRLREFISSSTESLMSVALLIGQEHKDDEETMTLSAFLKKLSNAGIKLDIETFKTEYNNDTKVQTVINDLIKSNILDGKELEYKPEPDSTSPDERVSKMADKAMRTREGQYEPGTKMKGGTDLNKFLGKSDDKDEKYIQKIEPQIPNPLGRVPFARRTVNDDVAEKTSWTLRRNTSEGKNKLKKGHPNYKAQAAAIAISQQNKGN